MSAPHGSHRFKACNPSVMLIQRCYGGYGDLATTASTNMMDAESERTGSMVTLSLPPLLTFSSNFSSSVSNTTRRDGAVSNWSMLSSNKGDELSHPQPLLPYHRAHNSYYYDHNYRSTSQRSPASNTSITDAYDQQFVAAVMDEKQQCYQQPPPVRDTQSSFHYCRSTADTVLKDDYLDYPQGSLPMRSTSAILTDWPFDEASSLAQDEVGLYNNSNVDNMLPQQRPQHADFTVLDKQLIVNCRSSRKLIVPQSSHGSDECVASSVSRGSDIVPMRLGIKRRRGTVAMNENRKRRSGEISPCDRQPQVAMHDDSPTELFYDDDDDDRPEDGPEGEVAEPVVQPSRRVRSAGRTQPAAHPTLATPPTPSRTPTAPTAPSRALSARSGSSQPPPSTATMDSTDIDSPNFVVPPKVTGVHWDPSRRRWYAMWYHAGTRTKMKRSYSIGKHGYAEAREMAIYDRRNAERGNFAIKEKERIAKLEGV